MWRLTAWQKRGQRKRCPKGNALRISSGGRRPTRPGARWYVVVQRLESRLLLCTADDLPGGEHSVSHVPLHPELRVAGSSPAASTTATAGAGAGVGASPLTAIPALSSLPGAPASLYLDFDG